MRNFSIKYLCLYIIMFFCQNTFGQLNSVPSEYISNFDLKGNVKLVIEDKTEEVYVTNDKKELIRNIKTYSFNKKGYLLEYYLKNNDGFKYLNEKNEYDTNNNLIYKLDQQRKDTLNDEKRVWSERLKKYEKKYTYNKYGSLLTQYQKSYRDKGFYFVKSKTYKDNLLIESLSINNNIPFQYSDSFFRNTLSKYTYNSDGLLINRKEFHNKKSRYYVADSSGANIIKPIKVKDVDYSRFNLRTETFYKYNEKCQQISSKSITHDKDYDYGLDVEKLTEYYGTKEKKISFIYKEEVIYSTLYEYDIRNNDTLVSTMWYISKLGKDSPENKHKVFEIRFEEDGTHKKLSYNSDEELEKTTFYNSKGDTIEKINHETKRTSKFYYTYNDDGNLMSKKIKIKNSKGEITSALTRKYDVEGNWIYEELLNVTKNKIRRLIKREITYYS